MDKIFSYNEIEKTAYINLKTRIHEPLHNMSVIADGYFKGAIMMAEDCLRDNHNNKADIHLTQAMKIITILRHLKMRW